MAFQLDAFVQGLELLEKGGAVVVVLGLLSVAALTLVFAKLLQFAASGLFRRALPDRVLGLYRDGRAEEALALLAAKRHPVARPLVAAIRGKASAIEDEARLKEEVARLGAREVGRLQGGLRPLALIATLSPLLGLLGTVLGMIEAFQKLEQAGSRVDPAILSGGIWEALMTTAAGLIVAIPATALVNWLQGLVNRCAADMEDAVTQVFTGDLFERSRVTRFRETAANRNPTAEAALQLAAE